MKYIYDRTPWTEWKIILESPYPYPDEKNKEVVVYDDSDFLEFECFYRSGLRDADICEIFTLMLKNSDNVFLRIYILKNGDTECIARMPMTCTVNSQEKTVTILPLATVKLDEETGKPVYELYDF